MKISIICSGISGLSSALLLSQEHNITLYEYVHKEILIDIPGYIELIDTITLFFVINEAL